MNLAARIGLAVAIGAVALLAIGRAVDSVTPQYVNLTRDGVTFECERIRDVTGRTFYDSCRRVP
jgi:hypothetical protein